MTCNIERSCWSRGLTLLGRLRGPEPELRAERLALAESRLEQWRSQSPFSRGDYFTRRLAMDAIGQEQLLRLLGETAEELDSRVKERPGWMKMLAEALNRAAPATSFPLPAILSSEPMSELLEVIEPLIQAGRRRVQEGIEEAVRRYPAAPVDVKTISDLLFMSLPPQLLKMISRTLILELNVARLEGTLEGNTPEERFRSFVVRTRRLEELVALLEEYPVLARQLTIAIEHWVRFSLELVTNLCADWPDVKATFFDIRDPGAVVKISGNISDSHQEGRSVRILQFSDGSRLVYKPKPMAVDVHFQDLLAWINSRGAKPAFRTLAVMDRGDYGWVEYVPSVPCRSAEELRRFYERQGAYLALLYALEATDFHYENLKACGEHPVLLDLEALFHPHIPKEFWKESAEEVSDAKMNYSVLRVGLLPTPFMPNTEAERYDLSGLGSVAGQWTPFEVPVCEGGGTDEVRVTRKRLPMAESDNQPTLNGQRVNPLDFSEAIAEAFERTYRLLSAHRAELLAEHGPIPRFARDTVRVILRSTRIYAKVLEESHHPDVLRDALDRERFFDRIWFAVEDLPALEKVIAYERRDLWNGDIPIFTTRPDSRALWASAGEQIPDFFETSGLSLVRNRIERMGEEDLAQQLWFVRASMATLSRDVPHSRRVPLSLMEPKSRVDRRRLLAAAKTVAERLATLANHGEEGVSWIGLAMTQVSDWLLTPLGPELYDGLPGIALFLGYLGAVTGEDRHTALAKLTLASARRQMSRYAEFRGKNQLRPSIGGFNGWGGYLYTLVHLGTLWNDSEVLLEAREIPEILAELIERDNFLDIAGGSAGCILVLLGLYQTVPTREALTAAVQCGDRLIARAQRMPRGAGWTSKAMETRPLAGFSHGAAGIGQALLELSAASGQQRFREMALQAFEYERSLFSPKHGNWPDLRDPKISGQPDGPEGVFFSAWCHGAAGIGLSRLRALRHSQDAEMYSEVEAALATTVREGFGLNHSLCHGDLGNVGLLMEAARVLDDRQWQEQADRFASLIVEDIERRGWVCGNPLQVESPGLMTGLAGIGYGLLRLAEPDRVPSVLMLEPPAAATGRDKGREETYARAA